MTNWPDENKPGYPVDADKSGWHWLKVGDETIPQEWNAQYQFWRLNSKDVFGTLHSKLVACGWQYIGPCTLGPDWKAGREQAVEWLLGHAEELKSCFTPGGIAVFKAFASAIQSLPPPTCKDHLQVDDDSDALLAAYQMGAVDLSVFEALADGWAKKYQRSIPGTGRSRNAAYNACAGELRAVIARVKGGK